jgi:hypothetical protein
VCAWQRRLADTFINARHCAARLQTCLLLRNAASHDHTWFEGCVLLRVLARAGMADKDKLKPPSAAAERATNWLYFSRLEHERKHWGSWPAFTVVSVACNACEWAVDGGWARSACGPGALYRSLNHPSTSLSFVQQQT